MFSAKPLHLRTLPDTGKSFTFVIRAKEWKFWVAGTECSNAKEGSECPGNVGGKEIAFYLKKSEREKERALLC